jgi:hypothetical protein
LEKTGVFMDALVAYGPGSDGEEQPAQKQTSREEGIRKSQVFLI